MKTEIEEAAKEYVKTLEGVNYRSLYDFATQQKLAFIKGANWQAEKILGLIKTKNNENSKH